MLHKATPERVSTFSDGVFAVLITVLVLDLRSPPAPTYGAMLLLWPTWLSYAVSYLFIRELIDRTPGPKASHKTRRMMRFRSLTTLLVFASAAGVALRYPLAGLGLCICCLVVYLRPDPPGTGHARLHETGSP